MKKINLILFALFTCFSAFSQFDFYATAVYLGINGNSSFYNTTAPGNGQDIGSLGFQNTQLGTFYQNSGNLKITGGEVKTFKSGNGNVCGSTLFFTVYPKDNRPQSPVYTSVGLGFYSDCIAGTCGSFTGSFPAGKGGGCCNTGDQKWQYPAGGNGGGNNGDVDITTYAPGDYTLEVYFQVTGEANGNGCGESRYDNNGSAPANYTAFFSISQPLPVKFGGVSATALHGKNRVDWSTYSEMGSKLFLVERSGDGIHFEVTGTVAASGNSGSLKKYTYTDNNPIKGTSFYRIKMVEYSGRSQYSSIAKVDFYGSQGPSLSPNPAREMVTVSSLVPGSNIRIINGAGATVYQAISSGNTCQVNTGNLVPGRYTIQVTHSKSAYHLPLLVTR